MFARQILIIKITQAEVQQQEAHKPEIIRILIIDRQNKIIHVVITQHDQLNQLQAEVLQLELVLLPAQKVIVVHQEVVVLPQEAATVLLQEAVAHLVALEVALVDLLPQVPVREVVVGVDKLCLLQ